MRFVLLLLALLSTACDLLAPPVVDEGPRRRRGGGGDEGEGEEGEGEEGEGEEGEGEEGEGEEGEGEEGEGEEGEGEEGEGEEGEGEEGEGEEGEGEGAPCDGPPDCAQGFVCQNSQCTAGNGQTCDDDDDCPVGDCVALPFPIPDVPGVCSDASEGEGEEGEGEGADNADLDVRGIRIGVDGDFCANDAFFRSGTGTALTGPLATVCTPPLACDFNTCDAGSATAPDWSNDGSNSSETRPVIDIDDLNGAGPENLSVDALDDGTYLFGVFVFRADGDQDATLKVFLDGAQRLSRTLRVETNSWTEVALVRVLDGRSCVEDLTDVSTTPCTPPGGGLVSAPPLTVQVTWRPH